MKDEKTKIGLCTYLLPLPQARSQSNPAEAQHFNQQGATLTGAATAAMANLCSEILYTSVNFVYRLL